MSHSEVAEPGLRELQMRFVLPFAVFTASVVLFSGLFSILHVRSLIASRVQEEQLTSARAGAESISDFMDTAVHELQDISRNNVLTTLDHNRIGPILDSALEKSQFITALHLAGGGKVLISTGITSQEAGLLRGDECYEKTFSGTVFCFSGVERASDGSTFVYAFLPVVNKKGEIRAVLSGKVQASGGAVASVIDALHPGKSGFAYLVDGKGEMILSGAPKKSKDAENYATLMPVREGLEGRWGTTNYRFGGTRMMASFYPIQNAGWVIVVQRPEREIFSGMGTMYLTLAVFLIVGVVGAAVVAVILTQSFSRFIFTLAGRMDAVARGKMEQEIATDEMKELAPLARSFNHMLSSLREWYGTREKSYQELMSTARFHQSVLNSISDFFVLIGADMRILHISASAAACVEAGEAAVGRHITALGPSWSQRRILDALFAAVNESTETTLDGVRLSDGERKEKIFQLRIQPVSGDEMGGKGTAVTGYEVTTQTTENEKLRRSERYFRQLSEASPDGIMLLDDAERIEWWNSAAEKIFGGAE
ncbi:MAG: cache domain-containing protein, partial [bacterium]